MGLFSFESKQVKEWKKLAKSGDMDAQYHLARAYANGKGASQNMKKAVEYCVQSAEQEYAPAQALLAHFYGYGKGVEKDYGEMIHWGEKAALQGYAKAQYNMGRCYEMGKGTEADMEKAIELLEEVKESIINAYETKSHLSRNKIAKLMSDETWLNAKKAHEMGFVDGILFAEKKKPFPPEEEEEEEPDEDEKK